MPLVRSPVQCAFHPAATATTLCAACGRELCLRCATPGQAGRVCAPGCHAAPVPAPPEILVAAGRARVTVARWARAGLTAFLIALGAATLQLALLSLAGYVTSVVCLSVAWRRRRRARYLFRWRAL